MTTPVGPSALAARAEAVRAANPTRSDMKRVVLKHATVEYDHQKSVLTRFNDQTKIAAYPHPDDPHYHVISHRCGYGDDLWQYCFEHEVAHNVVAEFFSDLPSYVLSNEALGLGCVGEYAVAEEVLAQMLQRYARANEEPIVSGVDWPVLKARFLEVMA